MKTMTDGLKPFEIYNMDEGRSLKMYFQTQKGFNVVVEGPNDKNTMELIRSVRENLTAYDFDAIPGDKKILFTGNGDESKIYNGNLIEEMKELTKEEEKLVFG